MADNTSSSRPSSPGRARRRATTSTLMMPTYHRQGRLKVPSAHSLLAHPARRQRVRERGRSTHLAPCDGTVIGPALTLPLANPHKHWSLGERQVAPPGVPCSTDWPLAHLTS